MAVAKRRPSVSSTSVGSPVRPSYGTVGGSMPFLAQFAQKASAARCDYSPRVTSEKETQEIINQLEIPCQSTTYFTGSLSLCLRSHLMPYT
uniref:Uncharacterized protein n=1 Tax=Cannabis sativa TaxID=3483 RepID=A0A803QDR0_CANSA